MSWTSRSSVHCHPQEASRQWRPEDKRVNDGSLAQAEDELTTRSAPLHVSLTQYCPDGEKQGHLESSCGKRRSTPSCGLFSDALRERRSQMTHSTLKSFVVMKARYQGSDDRAVLDVVLHNHYGRRCGAEDGELLGEFIGVHRRRSGVTSAHI